MGEYKRRVEEGELNDRKEQLGINPAFEDPFDIKYDAGITDNTPDPEFRMSDLGDTFADQEEEVAEETDEVEELEPPVEGVEIIEEQEVVEGEDPAVYRDPYGEPIISQQEVDNVISAVDGITPEEVVEKESFGAKAKEVGKQAIYGVGDAINSTWKFIGDVFNLVPGVKETEEELQTSLAKKGQLRIFSGNGSWQIGRVTPEEAKKIITEGNESQLLPTGKAAEGTGSAAVRSITGFMVAYAIPGGVAMKAAKVAKAGKAIASTGKVGKRLTESSIAKASVRGTVADAIIADPNHQRLSVLASQIPALEAIIPDYMGDANKENDNIWEIRLKAAIEGAVLGLVADTAVLQVVKVIKQIKAHKLANKGVVLDPDQAAQRANLDAQIKEDAEKLIVKPIKSKTDDSLVKATETPEPIVQTKKDVKKVETIIEDVKADINKSIKKDVEVSTTDLKESVTRAVDNAGIVVDPKIVKEATDKLGAQMDEAIAAGKELDANAISKTVDDIIAEQSVKLEGVDLEKAIDVEADRILSEQPDMVKALREVDVEKQLTAATTDVYDNIASITLKGKIDEGQLTQTLKDNLADMAHKVDVDIRPDAVELNRTVKLLMDQRAQGQLTKKSLKRAIDNLVSTHLDTGAVKGRAALAATKLEVARDAAIKLARTRKHIKPRAKVTDAKEQAEALLQTNDAGVTYLNHSRINTTEDIHTLLENTAKVAKKGPSKTFEGIKEEAKKTFTTVNELLGQDPKRPFTAEESYAARTILNASAENLVRLSKLVSTGKATKEEEFFFRGALEKHAAISDVILQSRKATAQSLGAWRITANTPYERGLQVTNALAGKTDSKKMAGILNDLAEKSPTSVSKAAIEMNKPGWRDVVFQVWINGLLSSPRTHIVNITSNAATVGLGIIDSYATVAAAKLLGHEGASFRTAHAKAFGTVQGIMEAFSVVAGRADEATVEALKVGTKVDSHVQALSAKAWGKAPDSATGKALDRFNNFISLPGDFLQTSDIFFKSIAYRQAVNENAMKKALQSGTKDPEKFAAILRKNITEPTDDVSESALEYGKFQTFTKASGPITKQFDQLAALKYSPLRWIMPFRRTPGNIMSRGLSYIPGANLILEKNFSKLFKGGTEAEKAEIMGRMGTGIMLMTGVGALTVNGRITGSGPTDWAEKQAWLAAGNMPYSIRVGDKLISYERVEPFSTFMALSADVVSSYGIACADNDDLVGTVSDLALLTLSSQWESLKGRSYVQGLAEFISLAEKGDETSITKYIQRQATTLVPYSSMLKSLTKTVRGNEMRDYTPEEDSMKIAYRMMGELTPGGKDAPVKKDIWGADRMSNAGMNTPMSFLSPINIKTNKRDKVSQLIAESKVAIRMPERSINGTKLKNTEYSYFCEIAGKRAKKRLDAMYASGAFKNMPKGPDSVFALTVKTIITNSRKEVKAMVLNEFPELKNRMIGQKQEERFSVRGINPKTGEKYVPPGFNSNPWNE